MRKMFFGQDGKTNHKLTKEYIIETFRFLLNNKSMPLFKGWERK